MESVKVKGVLQSVGNTVKQQVNAEGKITEFRTCTVLMPTGKTHFAKIYEKSFQNGAKIGEEYTVELREDGDNVWLTVLTGGNATVATKADFADLFAKI
jgi:hypothetical protein